MSTAPTPIATNIAVAAHGPHGAHHGDLATAVNALRTNQDAQTNAADTLANGVTTEQNFATTYTLPASYFATNKTVRVTAVFSTTAGAAPVTQTIRLKLGAVLVYSQSAVVTPTASVTRGFSRQWYIQGTAAAGAAVGVETGGPVGDLPTAVTANATAQPVTVATNAAQAVTVSVTFGATGGLDSVTLRQLIVEKFG